MKGRKKHKYFIFISSFPFRQASRLLLPRTTRWSLCDHSRFNQAEQDRMLLCTIRCMGTFLWEMSACQHRLESWSSHLTFWKKMFHNFNLSETFYDSTNIITHLKLNLREHSHTLHIFNPFQMLFSRTNWSVTFFCNFLLFK